MQSSAPAVTEIAGRRVSQQDERRVEFASAQHGHPLVLDAVFHDIVRVRIGGTPSGPASFGDVHAFVGDGEARFVSAYLMLESRESAGADLQVSTHGHPVATLDWDAAVGESGELTVSIVVNSAVELVEPVLAGVGPLALSLGADLAIAAAEGSAVEVDADGSRVVLSGGEGLEFYLIQGPNESKLRTRYELLSSVLRYS